MPEKLIAVSSEIAERLERLAEQHSQTIDEYLASLIEGELLENNWMLDVYNEMEASELDSDEVTYGSTEARKAYEEYVFEKWKRTQESKS